MHWQVFILNLSYLNVDDMYGRFYFYDLAW
jgi:hypothetical protein